MTKVDDQSTLQADNPKLPVVAFVNATETWGGIKTWMLDLARFLGQKGWPVLIVCRRGDRLAQLARAAGIQCREVWFGPDYNPFLIAQLWWYFRKTGVSVVVTNTSKCLRIGGIAAKLAGARHVNRLGSYGDVRNRLKTRIDYALWVDEVVLCSHHLAAAFSKWSWLADKINVFHNGTVVPDAAEKPPLTPDISAPINIAIIAMLSRRKQVHQVIEVLANLRHFAWHLHIGGTGPEAASLETLARNLDLSQRITFHGMVRPSDLLQTTHLGVLYSSEEAFGTAIIEYMAHGCAVIASKTGGAEEIFRKAHSFSFGTLVDPHDATQLAAALKTCFEDRKLTMSWGLNARQAALACFTEKASFGAVADFLAEKTGSPENKDRSGSRGRAPL